MIRFIDLRHHEEDLAGDKFAFFDTVTARFLSFCDEQTWGDLEDLELALRASTSGAAIRDRLLRLLPRWVTHPCGRCGSIGRLIESVEASCTNPDVCKDGTFIVQSAPCPDCNDGGEA